MSVLALTDLSGPILDSCLTGLVIGLGSLFAHWQRESWLARIHAFLGPFVVVAGLGSILHAASRLEDGQSISASLFWFVLTVAMLIALAYGLAFETFGNRGKAAVFRQRQNTAGEP